MRVMVPGLVICLGASTCLYKLVELVRVEACWCWNVGSGLFVAYKLEILRSFIGAAISFSCPASIPLSIARVSIVLWWIHLLSNPNSCDSFRWDLSHFQIQWWPRDFNMSYKSYDWFRDRAMTQSGSVRVSLHAGTIGKEAFYSAMVANLGHVRC